VLVTAINWQENWVCYLLGYLGQRISCVSYWNILGRDLTVLVTGIFGSEN